MIFLTLVLLKNKGFVLFQITILRSFGSNIFAEQFILSIFHVCRNKKEVKSTRRCLHALRVTSRGLYLYSGGATSQENDDVH